ncbi:MAG: phospholipase [Rhodobacteraceae bacterium PARR1]|nr:MAG: phospholipase [Rhodobacteraceae bacterium PARR1]
MSIRELRFGRKGAAQGKATSLVVFVHGYGADGADLLDIGDVLAPHMPGTAFVAPDAPDRCINNAFGYQWFPIPWLDGSSETESRAGMALSVSDLNAFLDVRLQEYGLTPSALALIGFSQGGMMSLHIAPRRAEKMAGVVSISGRLLVPETLQAEVQVKPPVLLMHGDQDQVVPFEDMTLAGNALVDAGFETYGHVMRGMGHGISQDGLSVALQFLSERLPK